MSHVISEDMITVMDDGGEESRIVNNVLKYMVWATNTS